MIGLSDAELQTLRGVFARFPEIEEVILFGSRALGTHRPSSDVDLAIKGKNIGIDTLARLKYALEEETNLPYFFDVVDYGKIKNNDLIERIDKEGNMIYQNWCAELHNELNKENPDYEKVFLGTAKNLMKNYVLSVNNDKLELCELEFYFFDQQKHPDLYCHLSCKQLECAKFYVHRKGGNYGGIDITFGNGSFFGGILIRGVLIRGPQSETKFIIGPANCRKYISQLLGKPDSLYPELQKTLDNGNKEMILKKSPPNPSCVYKSTRIGLGDATCEIEGSYKEKHYRFIRADYFEKPSVKEKTKVRALKTEKESQCPH